jgi:hypothetical protein
MLERVIFWAVHRYVQGPARSWLYASLAVIAVRWVRSRIGRQELVELRPLPVGERIVVEQLPISHRRQIRDLRSKRKADRKAARRATRSARREAKVPAAAESVATAD